MHIWERGKPLYELLALVDAVRVVRARERAMAREHLKRIWIAKSDERVLPSLVQDEAVGSDCLVPVRGDEDAVHELFVVVGGEEA